MIKTESSIVSIFPCDIIEHRPGSFPNTYEIKGPEKIGDVVVTVIEDAQFWIELYRDHAVRIPIVSAEQAESIVHDYTTALLGVSQDAKPGLFALPGRVTVEEVKTKHKDRLALAFTQQVNWFKTLIKIAEDDWSRLHQHKAISELQRLAARALNIKADWMSVDAKAALSFVPCKFCTFQISNEAIVCPNCHNILNKELFDKLTTGK